jgi:hypothetical protein
MKLLRHNQRLIDSVRRGFVFGARPDPLPPDMRPEWRILVLLLALTKCGWGGKMTLKKAHVLNWAVRSQPSRDSLLRMLRGELQLEDVVVRFDPAFNRALDFAVGERLVSLEKKTTGLVIDLLPAGKKIAQNLETYKDCLTDEKSFFDTVKRVSQTKIEELLNWGTA